MFDLAILMVRLRTAREAKSLSQRQLTCKIGVSPRAIGKFEQGLNLPAAIDTLVKLANVLDVTVDYLVGNDSPQSN